MYIYWSDAVFVVRHLHEVDKPGVEEAATTKAGVSLLSYRLVTLVIRQVLLLLDPCLWI